ncbi:MAG: hypothetical protein HOJ60_07110 [Euryarchaeota archaeon]|jgi:hypothetical protein|nr:hypothetical protein [Euryarchaeota archaeon]
MAGRISEEETAEERKSRLKKPSLDEVRNEETGRFLNYDHQIPTPKGARKRWLIKGLPVHPLWFEDKETTAPGSIYLHPRAGELLRAWKVRSERLRQIRKWRPKAVTGKDKGEWIYQQNTPKGTTYVSKENRYDSEKNNFGMKPGKFAYKLRREVWRTFLNGKKVAKLLSNRKLDLGAEQKPVSHSFRIPNLEKALYQLIINEVWPNLGAQRTRVALEWSNFNKVQRHINEEERELFSNGLLDTDDDNRILKLICKYHWRRILRDFVERRIIEEHSMFEDILTPFEEDRNLTSEENLQIFYTKLHKTLREKGFSQKDNFKDSGKKLSPMCDPGCPGFDYTDDVKLSIKYCKNCGAIGGISFHTDDRDYKLSIT